MEDSANHNSDYMVWKAQNATLRDADVEKPTFADAKKLFLKKILKFIAKM